MTVKPHPTIEGAYLIDYWLPDGPVDPKTGKPKPKRHYETYPGSLEDATRRWTELVRRHVDTIGQKTNPTINSILTEFLEEIDLYKSKNYYKSMVWALEKLRPHFGPHPVSRITKQLVKDFQKKHRGTPVHCNQCTDYLKIIINWMVERGKANGLPFKIEKLPVFKKLPQPPSPEDFARFLESVEKNFKECGIAQEERDKKKALILIIYETGIRWVEARHVRWEHLRKSGELYLGRTKTGEGRFTIVTEEILDLLKPYRQAEGPIFINPATEAPYTNIRKLIASNAAKVGISLKGTHGLRHAMGTDSQESHGDIRGTQEILGHTTLKSTQIYTKVSTKRKRKLLEQVREYRNTQNGRKPTKQQHEASISTPDTDYMI